MIAGARKPGRAGIRSVLTCINCNAPADCTIGFGWGFDCPVHQAALPSEHIPPERRCSSHGICVTVNCSLTIRTQDGMIIDPEQFRGAQAAAYGHTLRGYS